jgi:hypothetical protein
MTITLKQAKANRALAIQNSETTFQGRPCKRGHAGIRYTESRSCVECHALSCQVRRNTPEGKEAQRRYNEAPLAAERRRKYAATARSQLVKLESRLRNDYGLTLDDYYQWVKVQDYRCPVCGKSFKQWEFSPDINLDTRVDHCHLTNKVRGILHNNCNIAVGWLEDNPNHAMNVASYLANPVID